MKFFQNFYLFLGIVWVISGCNRKLEYEFPEWNLYPIVEGKFRIYEVIDTTYNTSGAIPKKYFKKELTGGKELDLKNREISRLEILTGESIDSLSFQELWTQYLDATSAERIEGNTKYVVLKFPLKQKLTWNGNEFNNLGAENYVYTNIDTTVVIEGEAYPNCVYVQQRLNNSSLLTEIFTYEIYCRGIGKIKRYDSFKKYNLEPNGTRTLTTDSYFYEENLVRHNF